MEKVRCAHWTARLKLVWSCWAGHRALSVVQRMWVPQEPSGLRTRLQEKAGGSSSPGRGCKISEGWALGPCLAPFPRCSDVGCSHTYTWTPSTLETAGSLFLLASLQRPLLGKLNTVLALKETSLEEFSGCSPSKTQSRCVPFKRAFPS